MYGIGVWCGVVWCGVGCVALSLFSLSALLQPAAPTSGSSRCVPLTRQVLQRDTKGVHGPSTSLDITYLTRTDTQYALTLYCVSAGSCCWCPFLRRSSQGQDNLLLCQDLGWPG